MLPAVDLVVPDGTLGVLLGPSGAGKTTLLRAIGGLVRITSGSVHVGDAPVEALPPHRRGIGLVFQEPRLFPHLTAADNVAFALRLRRIRRTARRARALELLSEVGLAALADRPSSVLSGGEQQRVALARALAAEPRVLLLDEPFAAVDPNRRDALRRLLAGIQRERRLTTLLVTHDREEAALLGDSVGVLIDGSIDQWDAPQSLFDRPATPAVARFLGAAAVLRGDVEDGVLSVAGARIAVDAPDGPGAFTIRPEHVVLNPDGALRARVAEARYAGSYTWLLLAAPGLELVAHVANDTAPSVGRWVGVSLPTEHLWRFPGSTASSTNRQGVT